MAEWGSGSFTPGVYDKVVPGTYINITVTPNLDYYTDNRGYAAALVELPGGEDNKIITITKSQFEKHSEDYFGVPKDDPALLPVRELFCNAHTLYLYRLNSGGNKASGETGEAKYSGEAGNSIVVTVANNVDVDNYYDVTTYVNGEVKDTQTVPAKSNDTVSLTKGEESKGEDVKPVFINNWGYVTSVDQLTSIPGLSSANLPQDKKNIFYFQFLETLKNGDQYSAIFDVDGTKYALPLWNLKEGNKNLYLWLSDEDMSGSFKLDGENWSANTESVDVTGKTVKVSLYNYGKKVTAAVLKGQPTETLLEDVEVSCSANVENGSIDAGTPATVTYTFSDNKATVEFKDVPEGYKTGVRYKNDGIYGVFQSGVVENTEEDGKQVITVYPEANLDGTKTIEATLTKDKSVAISSCTFTCTLNKGEEEGADCSQLKDNSYVSFKKEGYLTVTGGDVYSGGTSGTTTGANYIEAKDLLESCYFNVLGIAATDKETQDTFIDYVIEQRDVNGVKFQLVIPPCPQRTEPVNHEGVITYSSINTVDNEEYKDNGLVFWLTGAEAGCPVQSNLTGTVYNGELEIEARVTRDQQKKTITGGEILFNKMGSDVVMLRDINTLVEVPEGSTKKNDDFKKNQTIRVIDGLAIETANVFNNFFIAQHLNNNEVNRAELKNQLIKVRQAYATIGAINTYDEGNMRIEPGERLGDVLGYDGVSVAGAMEFLYFELSIVAENFSTVTTNTTR